MFYECYIEFKLLFSTIFYTYSIVFYFFYVFTGYSSNALSIKHDPHTQLRQPGKCHNFDVQNELVESVPLKVFKVKAYIVIEVLESTCRIVYPKSKAKHKQER